MGRIALFPRMLRSAKVNVHRVEGLARVFSYPFLFRHSLFSQGLYQLLNLPGFVPLRPFLVKNVGYLGVSYPFAAHISILQLLTYKEWSIVNTYDSCSAGPVLKQYNSSS
jgi:hypothetical protein